MEQDVDDGFKTFCCTCLSSDRNLISLNNIVEVAEIFKLLMYDFAGNQMVDMSVELKQYACWECFAIMKKFARFKKQVHTAQGHLRVFTVGTPLESMDHAYLSQSLSSLESVIKPDYDRMYIDYTHDVVRSDDWSQQLMEIDGLKSPHYDVAQTLRENITLGIDDRVLGMPEIVVENPVTGVMSHIVVAEPISMDTFTTEPVKGELPELILDSSTSVGSVIIKQPTRGSQEDENSEKLKSGYVTEYMCEADMLAVREEAKMKDLYASAVYKCELCIIGFYNQQQVENHFVAAHRPKPGYEACKVCYVYFESSRLFAHQDTHYLRYVCRLCSHTETSVRAMTHHVQTHLAKQQPSALIKIGGSRGVKKKQNDSEKTTKPSPKPGDLRKLLSKTIIVGYKCLECDMFFKNSRARKNHVARCHREGLQCDHCKKRFVNRTTLATHLRLHEGPLPREKCPICNKMVRVIQLKYHIQRHQNTKRYECKDCDKVFSHLTTYQAHLKYSRPHASDQVFKFPCPMCNKGYPTKEAMQDHFNYQHLGKTTHKCPICNKPIASKANVEKHMMRVHSEKKEKPRTHVCQQCGKAFTDNKALSQHAVIHSADRPLSCDICQQTFKQKASLYTHRKRVHKVVPAKRVVEFMDHHKES